MATIQNTATKQLIYLNNQHTFGRNQQTSNTYLSGPDISQFHALILWKNNSWHLQDQSRNGTLINGKFLNNATIAIKKDTNIKFGEDPSASWTVLDCLPPNSYLKALDGSEEIIELDSYYTFPNEKNPEYSIYQSGEGWKLEQQEIIKDLTPNQQYLLNNKSYAFFENKSLEDTMDMGFQSSDAYFQFILSADEEHINLKLIIKNKKIDLGERVHNYILLALARKRYNDFKMGYTSIDQGWFMVEELLEELSKELNKEIDIYYVNLNIHRVRKLLLNIKPYGNLFSNIIERRPKLLRFSHPYFQIIKEEKSIGEILP